MATSKKAKKAAPKKKIAKKKTAKKSPPRALTLQQMIGSALQHPKVKGKKMKLHSIALTADDDPAPTCLRWENKTTETTDASGKKIITVEPVCVQWG